MIKIRATVLVLYNFDTKKDTKELAATLLADDNFTYQDYRQVTR